MDARTTIVAPLAAGFVVLAMFLGFGLLRGPTLDASVFMMVAAAITDGGMPYVDVWDHKLPGIYIAEAAVAWLPAEAWTRAWLLTAASAAGTLAVLAFAIARHITGDRLVIFGTVIAGALVLSADFSAHGGGYTESLAVLPASIGFVLGATSPSSSASRMVASGLALGSAVVVSPQFLPAVVAVLGIASVHAGRLRRSAAFLAGCTVVPVAVAAWLAINDAIPAALDAVVTFLRVYRSRYDLIDPASAPLLFFLILLTFPLLIGTIARTISLVSRRDGHPLEVAAAVWVLGSAAWVLFQSNLAGHYMIGVLPAMMVLAAGAFRPRADRQPWRVSIRHVALASSLGVSVAFTASTEPGPARNPLITGGTERLEALGSDGDEVFIWGNEPALYMDSGRMASGRYVYMIPLATTGYTTVDQIDAVADSWRSKPPAVIVDASYHPTEVSTLPLLGPWHFKAEQPDDLLDPLREIVRTDYVAAETLGDWTFYVPRSPS